MEPLFRFLFEYRPVVFQQGEFRLAPSTGSYIAAAIAIAAAAAAIVTYRRVAARGRLRDRMVLAGLRVATLLLVLFCLFRPLLVVRAAVPQQNFLAVLIDDSRSMQIPDWGSAPRGAFVQQAFNHDAALVKALSERFVVRTFRFSSAAGRLDSTADLTFAGAQTRLGAALDGARQELAGLPLAGMVLVSDGADTTDASLADALLGLKAAAVPVFTVGVGRDRLSRDVQVDRVSTPRSALQRHLARRRRRRHADRLRRRDGVARRRRRGAHRRRERVHASRPTASRPPCGSASRPRIPARGCSASGSRRAPGRSSPATTPARRSSTSRISASRFSTTRASRAPRWRSSTAPSTTTRISASSRCSGPPTTSTMRFLVEDKPDELLGGFPKTREELFAYSGLMLGSIEAGAFTGDQLRMIGEFVERRGGGLLMLGGPRAFAEGGYAGTPVADALPVILERAARVVEPLPVARLHVKPTRAGESHGVTQIAPTEAASVARWKDMPVLTSVNALTAVKPGATRAAERHRRPPRAGRARLPALRPRQGAGVPGPGLVALADGRQDAVSRTMTHENYWRQLLRWLVDGVPGPVDVHTLTDRVEPGESATLTADVVDPGVRGGERRPRRRQSQRPRRDRHGGADAVDRRAERPVSRGAPHRRPGVVFSPGRGLARRQDARHRGAPTSAPRRATRSTSMRRCTRRGCSGLREETGGRFYTPETVAGMPEDLRYTGRGVTTVEERELWHMPIVLLLFIGLLSAEWAYRRSLRLA